jgi:hypothetical protein
MLCTVYVSMCTSASVCVQQGHCLLCVRPGTACGTAALSATAAADYVQVAVLGLPWEYTSGDVRALLETAAEAAGLAPEEAGAETVAVAYREDGKSEVRRGGTAALAQQHYSVFVGVVPLPKLLC